MTTRGDKSIKSAEGNTLPPYPAPRKTTIKPGGSRPRESIYYERPHGQERPAAERPDVHQAVPGTAWRMNNPPIRSVGATGWRGIDKRQATDSELVLLDGLSGGDLSPHLLSSLATGDV